jgi:hypothetical protein
VSSNAQLLASFFLSRFILCYSPSALTEFQSLSRTTKVFTT